MAEQSVEAQAFEQEKAQANLAEAQAIREAVECTNPACIIHGGSGTEVEPEVEV